MTKAFIDELCDILNITTPTISYDTSHFSSPTMLAQCSSDGLTVYIKQTSQPNPDIFFFLAHELRHIWQIRTDEHKYFEKYQPRECFSDVNQYNLQLAEVDANAFAQIIMVSYFRLQPQFKGLSSTVKDAIALRAKQISVNLCFE